MSMTKFTNMSNSPTKQPEQKAKPIWERFEEFPDNLPEAVVAKLPTDGAAQLDHYLYGKPKSDLPTCN
jgi:hypothetical protein